MTSFVNARPYNGTLAIHTHVIHLLRAFYSVCVLSYIKKALLRIPAASVGGLGKNVKGACCFNYRSPVERILQHRLLFAFNLNYVAEVR